VAGVGEVHAGGGAVEQLPAVTRDGVGQVDDVEDLGAAGAGALHGSHAPGQVVYGRIGWCQS
jgi:hypothetical protein